MLVVKLVTVVPQKLLELCLKYKGRDLLNSGDKTKEAMYSVS